jgi:hypothetical protein
MEKKLTLANIALRTEWELLVLGNIWLENYKYLFADYKYINIRDNYVLCRQE